MPETDQYSPPHSPAAASIAGPKSRRFWFTFVAAYLVVSIGIVSGALGILDWYTIPPEAHQVRFRLITSAVLIVFGATGLAFSIHMAHDYRRRYHLLRDHDVVRDLYPNRDRLRTKYKNVLFDCNEYFRVVGISLHTLMSEPAVGDWIRQALADTPSLTIDLCFQRPYSRFVRDRERDERRAAGRISHDCLHNFLRALEIKAELGTSGDRLHVHQVESVPVGFFLQRDSEVYFEPYLAHGVGRSFPTFVIARNENNEEAFNKFVSHIDSVIEDAIEAPVGHGMAEPIITASGEASNRNGVRKAIFLDRDGVLVSDPGYISDPDVLHLLPGVDNGLRQIQDTFRLIIVTNQSGVARGYFTEAGLFEVNSRLLAMLGDRGVNVDALYYCPHHPTEGIPPYVQSCDCRKPQPGLILAAAERFGIELAGSFFVGDRLTDLEAGRAAGTKTVLVGSMPTTSQAALVDHAIQNLEELPSLVM